MLDVLSALLPSLLSGVQSQSRLALENLTLRHQLTVLNRQARKPKLRPADRLLWVVLGREDKGCSGEGNAQPIAIRFYWMNRLHRLTLWRPARSDPGLCTESSAFSWRTSGPRVQRQPFTLSRAGQSEMLAGLRDRQGLMQLTPREAPKLYQHPANHLIAQLHWKHRSASPSRMGSPARRQAGFHTADDSIQRLAKQKLPRKAMRGSTGCFVTPWRRR